MAEQMLAVFRAYGVSGIFSSPGTEWVPLWETFAKYEEKELDPPFYHLRHEELAAFMAIGNYRQTGKLPVLMFHFAVGPLKAAMALRIAMQDRIPMVILLGDSSTYGERDERIGAPHYLRSHGDVGGPSALIAPLVKRNHRVMDPVLLPGMLMDACRTALTHPMGPVALSVPIEFLREEPDRNLALPLAPAWSYHPPAKEVERIADALVHAKKPLIVTEGSGRRSDTVYELVRLAEALAIPVVEAGAIVMPAYMNFPRSHPLHQGYDSAPFFADADCILVVGCNVPWYPTSHRPKAAQKIILIDDYPTYDSLPYWGFSVDDVMGGDLTESLKQINECVIRSLDGMADIDVLRLQIKERMRMWEKKHKEREEQKRVALEKVKNDWPIDGRWLSAVIGEVLPPDGVIVEETTFDKDAILSYSNRTEPGTYHARQAGGLGVSLGIALGIKIARPDRPVVAMLGDGAFHYNPVLAAMGFAQENRVPFMAVVFDNGMYASMKEAHIRYYPDGWAVKNNRFVASPILSPSYVMLAEAYGGWGQRVESPDQLRSVFKEGLERMDKGQFVLVDVPTKSV